MAKKTNTLHLVAAAAGARQYAERSYREAIAEAAKTCPKADIARAAGVTRQAIQSMLRSLNDGGESGSL